MEVRAPADRSDWADAAQLLFAYQQETAVDVGASKPGRPQDVWVPVRQETVDPSSTLSSYLLAYEAGVPVGGVALVAHDGLSLMFKRCYVRRQWRRRGVATALVAEAAAVANDRGVTRLVLDVLRSRRGAVAAWRRMGFMDAEAWGDPSMAYLERPAGDRAPGAWLGVRRGQVVLSETDVRWAEAFRHQAEVVRRALGDRLTAVEHVGSTAVPGLLAKPIVDVAVRITADAEAAAIVRSLEGRGYGYRGDKLREGGHLFVLDHHPEHRIAHIHVVRDGDPQWARYLDVRDRLRADADARMAYSALKLDLARRFPSDRPAYTSAKGPFIRALLGDPR